MELIIFFKSKAEVELQLNQDGGLLDRLIFALDIHFDTMLVTSIDKILKRNKIDSSSLKTIEVKVISGLESSSAYNIATAVGKAIKSRN